MTDPHAQLLRLDADALADAHVEIRPASLLLGVGPRTRVLAVGSPAEVDRAPGARTARRIHRPGFTLIPGLVNAHTHLDLTHIGPRPYDPERGFAGWIDTVRRERHRDPEAVRRSVARGAAMSLAGGVVAVGDIAGAIGGMPSLAAAHALASTALGGTSFLEFFALRARQSEVIAACEDLLARWPVGEEVRLGLQPHAPYSVGIDAYRRAMELATRRGMPVCTHLAETLDEARFIAQGDGPLADMLRSIGVLTEADQVTIGRGRSPVEHVQDVLASGRLTAVHLNHLTDRDVGLLGRSGGPAVYCPRASDYFGAPAAMGPHRYRDLLAAGVPVALGTDSIINLPEGSTRISTWDEMVYLRRRDGTDARALLSMATIHGARAIGEDPDRFAFKPGREIGGVVGVAGASLGRALDAGGDLEILA